MSSNNDDSAAARELRAAGYGPAQILRLLLRITRGLFRKRLLTAGSWDGERIWRSAACVVSSFRLYANRADGWDRDSSTINQQ